MTRSSRHVALSMLVAPLLVLSLFAPASASPRASERRVGRAVDERQARRDGPALTPSPRDALTRALGEGGLSEAEYALERARSLFGLRQVRARFGRVARPGPRDATLILRDLAVRIGELDAADREAALRLLARPTDGAADPYGDWYTVAEAPPVCSTNACYHHVTSTEDAPDLTDADVNGVPDWIDALSAVTEQVWATEVVAYGYRAPKPDATSPNPGPDGRIDVYVADVGADGLYGYCATDDPNAFDPNYPYWDVSAFCVVDDDYSLGQFPFGSNGLEALQVTVAHEFFHAVQYAYDAFEDRWFLEGTATWMEDEVFDAVDDNLQYLFSSPLQRPGVPLDLSDPASGHVYGAWIWFRFLAEYFGDPAVIREAWVQADGSAGGPDRYSLQALAKVIRARGQRFRRLFADFGLWNVFPDTVYEEGAAYPSPAFDARHRITARRDLVSGGFRMDHLTTSSVRLVPRRGVGPRAKLLLAVDGPRYATGAEASALTVARTGKVRWYAFQLNRRGDGVLRVPFGKGKISSVVLILTNASTRSTCWVDPTATYSCFGDPMDDRQPYAYAASLIP